ncbi:hypothetical protein [Acinetobacter pittii]|uniref:hypothetical protein n=1 Tax=Acinetobacter pittii TaxID=48296 RepID=UPI00190127D1|nr:hypothetical protein [Acinetobacter pittii]MBJ9937545.1 hypothetical protein [Acinetobacter pittii]
MLYKFSSSSMPGFKASTCYFLLLFCSFFSINSLPINPVYCLGIPLVFISFFFLKANIDKFQFGYYIYFLISSVLFLIGSYYFSFINKEVATFSTILYLYCILLGAQVIGVGLSINKNKRKEIYKLVFNFLIIFMLLELILRFLYAGHTGSFYDYKASFFFSDSNFTSFVILFFLMFSMFLKDKGIWDLGKIKFLILLFLLVMTFSRASIISFFISYIFSKSSSKFRTPVFIIFLAAYFYSSYLLVNKYIAGNSYVDIDGSFNSKFYIISVAIDNYSLMPYYNKLFGIGLSNFTYYADGRFAHNMLVTLVYEFGILGSLSFILFLFYAYKKIGKDFTYILVPLLVAGFSLFSAYMPFFFVLISCIYIELKDQRSNQYFTG